MFEASVETEGWSRLCRLIAYSRSVEALGALGVWLHLPEAIRAAARAILVERDAPPSDAEPCQTAAAQARTTLGQMLSAEELERLDRLAIGLLNRTEADEVAAFTWDRFLASWVSDPGPATSPYADILRRGLDAFLAPDIAYWRSRPAGDAWDAAFEAQHPEWEAAVYVWQALLLRAYDFFMEEVLRQRIDTPALIEWANREAQRLGRTYLTLELPLPRSVES